ncbi:TetR/AcrR family transcriptional regulator [Sorangium sp. So ce388]|uniref:TetR/AcrR family transcriptional regulator n=1 Tax=Sorangium sp. So ce388 TaxID=3133309 RepID=UPI003F5BE4CE
MPKLWNDTLESHRREVRDAILDAAAAIATERGVPAVTMSEVAERTGIGRATLYKYFPDVQAILVAWHERQVGRHLAELLAARDQAGEPERRLEIALGTYARITHEEHGTELVALLRHGEHVTRGYQQLSEFLRDLIAEGAKRGRLRDDVPPAELASFCLHALSAASSMPSLAAVRRLVSVTLAGLQPPKR